MTLPLPSDGAYGLGLLLGGSLRTLWQQRTAFLRAAVVPLAIMLVQGLLNSGAPLEGDPFDLPTDEVAVAPNWTVTLFLTFLDLLAIAIFSVSWYRFLLGYGRPGLWPGLHGVQARYLWRMVVLAVLPLAPLLLLTGEDARSPLILAACLALLYPALRCSLVLPAAAAEVPLSFRQSWRATAGSVLPLLLAPLLGSLAIAFVVGLPFLLLAGLFLDAGQPHPGPVAAALLWLEFGLVALLTVGQAAVVLAIAAVRLVPDPQNA